MATRTVRLDDEAEAALEEIRKATGLPISEALKQGLRALRERVGQESGRTPFDVYRQLDLGPGGYAVAPSTRTRQGVASAIRRKLGRSSSWIPARSLPSSILAMGNMIGA